MEFQLEKLLKFGFLKNRTSYGNYWMFIEYRIESAKLNLRQNIALTLYSLHIKCHVFLISGINIICL